MGFGVRGKRVKGADPVEKRRVPAWIGRPETTPESVHDGPVTDLIPRGLHTIGSTYPGTKTVGEIGNHAIFKIFRTHLQGNPR